MTTNQSFIVDLRNQLSAYRHSPSGGRAYLHGMASNVERYIDYCAAESKRWTAARERIEADFNAQVGTTLPPSVAQPLLHSVAGTIYDNENEIRDLHSRLVTLLHEIQEELSTVSP